MNMPPDLRAFVTAECAVAETRLEETASAFSESAPGRWLHSVHTHVPVGPAKTELLALADEHEAELIVLGAVGHSGLDRVLLGSVSDYVATHADVSTLVVRPRRDSELPPSLNRVVMALSGTAEDQRMIDWLGGLHLKQNVEVHLVRILQLENMYRQDIRQKASAAWDAFVLDAQCQILDYETQLQSLDLNSETHLVEAYHVGEALIDYAERHGCDLIMTGDSDSGLLTRMFLGSTSRYVLRHAQCSILIIRDKEDRLKAKQDSLAGQESVAD